MQGLMPLPDGAGQVFMKPLNFEAVLMEDLKNPYSQQDGGEDPEDPEPPEDPPQDDDAEDEDPPDDDPPEEEQTESATWSWPELIVNAVSRQRVTPRAGTRSDQIKARLRDALLETADNARKRHEQISKHLLGGSRDKAIDEIMRSAPYSMGPLVAKLTSIYLLAAEFASANLAHYADDEKKISALEPLYELESARKDCSEMVIRAIKTSVELTLTRAIGDIDIEDLMFIMINSIGVRACDVEEFVKLEGDGDAAVSLYDSFVEEMADHLIVHMCNAAMESLWSEAVREGILDQNGVSRLWITRRDCRSCDECKGMDGVATEIDKSWKLPDGGTVVTPTKAHVLCHCTEQLVRKEARK